MSQSDYIQQKKNIAILNNSNNNLADVLSNTEYTEFKKYSISNTVENTIPTLHQLRTLPKTYIRVFGSEYKRSCNKNVLCQTKNAYYERRSLNKILPTGYKQQIATNNYFLTYKKKRNQMSCDSFYDCEKFFFLKNQRYEQMEQDDLEDTFFFIG